MTERVTYQGTLAVAKSNGVAPLRCGRCGSTPPAGLDWQAGYDDGTDPQYVGYECQACGNIQGISRAAILRRIRAKRQREW